MADKASEQHGRFAFITLQLLGRPSQNAVAQNLYHEGRHVHRCGNTARIPFPHKWLPFGHRYTFRTPLGMDQGKGPPGPEADLPQDKEP